MAGSVAANIFHWPGSLAKLPAFELSVRVVAYLRRLTEPSLVESARLDNGIAKDRTKVARDPSTCDW
jgi:hypothetical protein